MPSAGRAEAGPVSTAPRLAPRWAAPAAVAAFVVGGLIAALVWHATKLNRADAWMLHWQDLAYDRANSAAVIVSNTLVPVVVLTMLTCAAAAWRARRRDATVLALVAAPAALAAELVLKQVVHRQWNGDPALLFPSGHVAVATAAAVTAVLVVRVTPVGRRTRLAVAVLGGGYVLIIAVARLVETVHALTDLLGGVATGFVAALGAALAITAWTQRSQIP